MEKCGSMHLFHMSSVLQIITLIQINLLSSGCTLVCLKFVDKSVNSTILQPNLHMGVGTGARLDKQVLLHNIGSILVSW
jgi:hypothetical protein